jgi:putative SOS response-associated peptidase YedK
MLGAEAPDPTGFEPSFNIAPTQLAPVLTAGAERPVLRTMRWGLIPFWSKDGGGKLSTINARAEALAQRPAYRAPFRSRRCLVPADGFYEWQRLDGRKQPYFIRLRSQEPMVFAGLWDRWRSPHGEEILSFAIVTTRANAALAPIHARMPAILAAHLHGEWLDRSNRDEASLLDVLEPFPDDLIEAYPVSSFVNRPENNDARCVEPLSP